MDKKDKILLKEYLSSTEALIESLELNLRSDSENTFKHSSYLIYMRKYNQLIELITKIKKVETVLDYFNLEAIPGPMNATIIQQKEFFEAVSINLLILKRYLINILDIKNDEFNNLRNFLNANLRKAIFNKPTKELQIQNSIEQLLIGKGFSKGIDYDRETGRVKYSGKENVPDFIFPLLNLALEVKFCDTKEKSKSIVDGINSDILTYREKYSFILFIVYDVGIIRDVVEFKKDLEKQKGVEIIIIKH